MMSADVITSDEAAERCAAEIAAPSAAYEMSADIHERRR